MMMGLLKSLRSYRWLQLGRAGLTGYVAILILLSAVGTILFPAYARLHTAEFTPSLSWTPAQTQAGLAQLGLPATLPAYVFLVGNLLILLAGSIVALLLLWRRPGSWYILYLAFVLVSIMGGGTLFKPLIAALPGLKAYSLFMQGAGWQFFFILFFFFPNGRSVPVWTGWVGFFWLGLIVADLFHPGWFNNPASWLDFLFTGMVFCAIGSQFFRYIWRSNPVQRQQTKWIVAVLALILVESLVTGSWLSTISTSADLRKGLLLAVIKNGLDQTLFSLIPLAILLAIFRYRLWDIDLVIRRTLFYAVLTGILAGIYYGSILILGQLFRAFTGQDSPLAVVISTLAIVILFTPLRRGLQVAIDRRFYRQKYNAERAVTAFAAAASDQVELASLSDQLANTVQESLQPESISLWLKKQEVHI
jgi:hypothetical protein